ncbi:RDD family protein [Thalassococcus sp. S3]|uniref:RDD family protein n=1 Tax=Thalassococcus sp. S3 TaxID=2017482 RepID=UPI001024257E|nr:RDD family protein [Thalassococcus sp. S3]QBF31483.1 hypothetical protein CFI11_09665 [Thalassococcus sp. S3]
MHNLPDPYHQPQFYASVPAKRFFAWVIDIVLTFALCLMILPFTAFTGIFFFPALLLIVGFCYRVVTLANGSATLGMRFAAIELRTADGERFDLGAALMHTLGYTVSFAIPILQVASVVMMLTGARGQGLTDSFMGSVALNRRALLRG